MKKNWKLIGLGAFFAVLLVVTYSNHFKNGFYFDDHHTIVNNTWIRDIKNLPKFFTHRETISIYPKNQGGLRPVVTALNAIDYHLAGKKLNSTTFHIHMFIHYFFMCVLLYFVFIKIFDHAHKNDWNKYIALICTAFYAHHTANAETLNYIISRSDLFSTLCLVLSFVLFINKKSRKYLLYLIPFMVALLTKEVSFMLPFIMIIYVLMFEEELSIPGFVQPKNIPKIFKAIKKTLPFFLLLAAGLLFFIFVYQSNSEYITRTAGFTFERRMNYFMTQSFVLTRYTSNFLMPFNLSADPDITIIRDWSDLKIIFGILHLLFFAVLAVLTSLKRKTRPIAFGLLWFYIFLAPTSTFNVMFQISNDHRTFIAYIGLVMALGWAISLLIYHLKEQSVNPKKWGAGLLTASMVIIGFYAYGTHERNKVWSSSESLWYDVTIKSPNNPRGLMNYGLALMAKGELEEAKGYYERALAIWPGWIYLHINMAILLDSQKNIEEADEHFNYALKYGADNPDVFYFYGRTLFTRKKYTEALDLLKRGQELSPYHSKINDLIPTLEKLSQASSITLKDLEEMTEPSSAQLLKLSLAYYRNKQYEECIDAAKRSLTISPENATAYNNICAAHCALKQWNKAVDACNRSLEINPEFERAQNNLNWAVTELNKTDE